MPYVVMLDLRDGSEPRISEEKDTLLEAQQSAEFVRAKNPATARVWIEETH